MKKKKKMKAMKKAFKELTRKDNIKTIRDLLGMQDYGKKKVKKAFKLAIDNFLKTEFVDDEQRYWAKAFDIKKDDDDVTVEVNGKKVSAKSKNRDTIRKISDILNR